METCSKIKHEFLESHNQYANVKPLTHINHVITYTNGHLSLWRKNLDDSFSEVELLKTPALEENYILIKSISHLSVWLSFVLQSIIDGKVKSIHHDQDLQKIKFYLSRLKEIEHDWLKNERSVMNKIEKIIDQVSYSNNIIQINTIYFHYLLVITTINKAYSLQATQLQLHGMNHIVLNWIKQEDIKLDKTRVLIACAHGPRQDLIEKQYFLDLYSKQGIENAEKESGHIICVEMLPEQIDSLDRSILIDFLKKHLLNSQIGKTMLGDPNAMNKDVLGEYAPGVLNNLCPIHHK